MPQAIIRFCKYPQVPLLLIGCALLALVIAQDWFALKDCMCLGGGVFVCGRQLSKDWYNLKEDAQWRKPEESP